MMMPDLQGFSPLDGDSPISQEPDIILISNDRIWLDLLSQFEVSISYRNLTKIEAQQFFQHRVGLPMPCRLVVIDAGEVSDCLPWIKFLRDCWSEMSICIVTSIPNWRTARLFHNAGASDVLAKNMNKVDLEYNLRNNLSHQGYIGWEELMNRFRVLCVDNRLDSLEVIKDALELKFDNVSVHCFQVKGLEDIHEIEERLKVEWWNFVIMDMALIREDEPANIDKIGLDLVVKSDPIVPKIIFTAYPGFQEYKKSTERKEDTHLQPAYEFISRQDDNALDKIVKTIQQALFSKHSPYQINIDLEIRLESNLSFPFLVLQVGGHGADVPIQTLNLAAQELVDLFRKLFADCRSIRIMPLSQKPTSFVMLEVEAERVIGIPWHGIVEVGARAMMQTMNNSWKTYIAPHVRSVSTFERFAETLNYAGMTFALDGRAEDFCRFSQYYHHASTEKVVKWVSDLFTNAFSDWVNGDRRSSPDPLGKIYRRALHLDRQGQHLVTRLNSILHTHPGVKPTLKQGVLFIQWNEDETREFVLPPVNILDLDTPFPGDELPELSITGGSLLRDGLWIGPQGQVWLTGSADTGEGFCLRDLISFEADIMFHLLSYPPDGASQSETQTMRILRGWLTPDDLCEEIPSSGWEADDAEKALAVLNTLRRQAWTVSRRVDIRPYYTGLFYHAVEAVLQTKPLRRGEDQDDAERAALAVMLLHDRLVKWPDWPLSLKLRGNQIEILKDHPQVILPWKTEPVELRPMELILIKFLDQHPRKVIPYPEIFKAVWNYDGAQMDGLNTLVRDLRKKIEPDPGQPRYLITHKREGLEYIPDGVRRVNTNEGI
jgi:DNA-binding response OmpR family regulator